VEKYLSKHIKFYHLHDIITTSTIQFVNLRFFACEIPRRVIKKINFNIVKLADEVLATQRTQMATSAVRTKKIKQ
jgi:hypothetical protein